MGYRALGSGCVAAALILTAPAAAQTAVAPENVTPGDVVTKPLTDLNIKKDEIPPILLAAREKPYDLTGLRRCAAIQSEIGQLDAVLGDDIDIATEKTRGEKRGNSVGNVAKAVVGSLIPFGGIIREISGANENQRTWNEMLYAGSVRRAFLKGIGQSKGCRYPARAATAADVARLDEARDAEDAPSANAESKEEPRRSKKKAGSIRYESRPVVQPVS